MPAPRTVKALAFSFAATVALTLAGCGGGGAPADGEQGAPVNPDVAKSQAQAYEEYAKTKQGGRRSASKAKPAEKPADAPADKPTDAAP